MIDIDECNVKFVFDLGGMLEWADQSHRLIPTTDEPKQRYETLVSLVEKWNVDQFTYASVCKNGQLEGLWCCWQYSRVQYLDKAIKK